MLIFGNSDRFVKFEHKNKYLTNNGQQNYHINKSNRTPTAIFSYSLDSLPKKYSVLFQTKRIVKAKINNEIIDANCVEKGSRNHSTKKEIASASKTNILLELDFKSFNFISLNYNLSLRGARANAVREKATRQSPCDSSWIYGTGLPRFVHSPAGEFTPLAMTMKD